MALISGFVVFSLIITFAYLLGILSFLTDHEPNGCEMTYMYEYPQFVRIHVKADKRFQKYKLYAYSEGRFTQNARNMKFTGIPILFIPGNVGSSKQVRSFASVALRKSLDSRPGFHFDFFTVDLNEEFSGLNGALLYEQTQYVNHSIDRILDLYKTNGHNAKNLILLGHSMGGIIARGLLNYISDKSILPLIITLATPHARPPIIFDRYLSDYYQTHKFILSNNTLIAISGGFSDYLITPFIATSKDLEHLVVITPAVPLVWLPVDHLCILWCKQLVLAVVRGLFDLVDVRTKEISLDTKFHQEVFQHHLVINNGLKVRKASQYLQSTIFSKGRSEWIENLQKHYTISLKNGAKQTQWHMIRLLNEEDYRYLKIVAFNLEVTDWVFACAATRVEGQRRICTDGIHLSHLSEIAPALNKKKRTLYVNTHELKRNYTDITHIVVKVLPTSDNVVVHVDRFLGDDRKIQASLPSFWSFKRDTILNETQEKVVYYDLMLPQLQQIVQYYKLYVEPIKCNSKTHEATASLIVPWGHQNTHKHITDGDRTPLSIRLHQSRPPGWNDSFPSIRLTLDPACRYSISIKNNIFGVLGQIARSYTPLLIANTAAVLLLTVRNQLIEIQDKGSCSALFNAIQHGIKPYYILPLVKIASRGLSWKGLSDMLPLPDSQIITEEGNEFLLLSLILYVTGVGIVWCAALGIAVCLIFCESTFHKIAAKFLARVFTGSVKLSDWLIWGLHKIPEIVATILVILSITTCGGLSLCLGCMFYFLKLTQMSQDYVEKIVLRVIKYVAKKFRRSAESQHETNLQNTESSQGVVQSSHSQDEENNCASVENTETANESDVHKEEEEEVEVIEELSIEKVPDENEQTQVVPDTNEETNYDSIYFHFSIFMLWCIVAGLNIPSVLTWAHNFKYSSQLKSDPSFMPGLVLSLCSLPLWHIDLPRRNIRGYSLLARALNVLAGVSLIYASLSIYRLNYIVTLTIVLITLQQMLSWKTAQAEPDNTTEEHTTETFYSDVKAKWE